MSWQLKKASAKAGLLLFVAVPLCWGQRFTKSDHDRIQQMLRNAANDVRKHYYDPKFHGVDWDAVIKKTEDNISKADTLNAAVSEVAAALDALNDSHTFFMPPPRPYVHEYGFRMQMIGERCFVIGVHKDSDAGKKGISIGDEILAINEHKLSRKIFWKLLYMYGILRPQPGLRLTLVDTGEHQKQIDILTKFTPSPAIKYFLHQGINEAVRNWDSQHHLMQPRYFDKEDLLVVQIPVFFFSDAEADAIISRMRKHQNVILDLRRNPGGAVSSLERLLAGVFQNDRKIGDRLTRESLKPLTFSGRHRDAFIGRLAVLVDSASASASEIFARFIQLERRGFVIGDRTSGSVMEAEHYLHDLSIDSGVFYGSSVTDADLLMIDGKSLEHSGVEPDILVLPTAEDLASQRDPVLSKAAHLFGVQISPEDAGKIFPDEFSRK